MTHLTLIYVACLCLGPATAGADFAERFRELFNRPTLCGASYRSLSTLLHGAVAADSAGVNSQAGDCTYTIRAHSRRVCQLRIDFDTELEQPGTTVEKPYPHCINDALLVDGLDLELCGRNTGQHIYVPWNVQSLRDTKRIRLRIASRRFGSGLPAATWKLRVTQIECAEKGLLFGRDGPLRAPAGCLQYFGDATGVFESFNLNNRIGPYLGDLTYGICFRRRPQDRQLRLQAEFFEMSQSVVSGHGYDGDCSSHVITPQSRQDFLAVREATFTTNNVHMLANRFCGTGIAAQQFITSRAPGPFMVHFSTDQQTSADERGFRFSYSIT